MEGHDPTQMAAQARALPDEETRRDYSMGRDKEMLSMQIYNDAINRIMEAAMPIHLSILTKDLTGTPPYRQNEVAGVAGAERLVHLHIFRSQRTAEGLFYHLTMLSEDRKGMISDGDIRIRDWHLVHYLQKAQEIISQNKTQPADVQ
jgi:hypothetical protein